MFEPTPKQQWKLRRSLIRQMRREILIQEATRHEQAHRDASPFTGVGVLRALMATGKK